MKEKGKSMKVSGLCRDFIENLRATRRSKQVGTDKEMLTQSDTLDLIVKYFKSNNDKYLEVVKLEYDRK